jgi:methionine salvage enolase-phosphatase E1
MIDVVLLDIEGTTTPIAFVHETLFTYMRDHLHEWVIRHGDSPTLRAVESQLAAEHRKPKETSRCRHGRRATMPTDTRRRRPTRGGSWNATASLRA